MMVLTSAGSGSMAAISQQYSTQQYCSAVVCKFYDSTSVFDGCNFTAILAVCSAVHKSTTLVVLEFYSVVVSGTAPNMTRSEKQMPNHHLALIKNKNKTEKGEVTAYLAAASSSVSRSFSGHVQSLFV